MFPMSIFKQIGKPSSLQFIQKHRCIYLSRRLRNASESLKVQPNYQHIFDRNTKKIQRERSAKQ